MSPNYHSEFEMDVVQRLTKIESVQQSTLAVFNQHLKWSEDKSRQIDGKIAEYDEFNTRVKTIGSLLAFLWITIQGWVLHKLGMPR